VSRVSDVDGSELCPDCGYAHDDWMDAGTAATPPGHRGQLDLYECNRCGYVLKGWL